MSGPAVLKRCAGGGQVYSNASSMRQSGCAQTAAHRVAEPRAFPRQIACRDFGNLKLKSSTLCFRLSLLN
jgi:hypothetical protein